jgi:GNAT superfamily N-acetyltransferase
MTPTVRPATPADTATLVEFNRLLAAETEGLTLDPAMLRAGVEALLRDPNRGRYLVAEEAGVVVGQVMWTFEWSDWRNGWLWWIQSVYVCADARRRGVFRALFERVVEAARRDGNVVGLRLYMERENHTARRTYERLGLTGTEYVVLERCPLDRGIG